MAAEQEGELVERLSRRLEDASAPRDLRRFLEWAASQPREAGFEDLLLERAAAGCGVSPSRTVAVFRELEALGAATFIVGRRGHPSRLRPGRHNLSLLARRALSPWEPSAGEAGASQAMLRHHFRLRPELGVELTLPSDLTDAEAERLAAFVRTLPFAKPARVGAASERVRLGMSALRISVPVMVALREGLFAREGLEVSVETFETAQPLMDAIASGALPAGGFIAFPISMAAELSGAGPLLHAAVMLEDDAHPVSQLLVRRGAGVGSLSELGGRRVGILPTVAYRAWLGLLLRSEGIDPAGVQVVEVPSDEAVSAVRSGSVDALFTNDPAATAVLASGEALALDPAPRVHRVVQDPLPFGSFVLTDALARERPHVARALVRGLDAAIDVVRSDPARARAALGHCLPKAERARVRLYPPSLYRKASSVRPELLADLSRRYCDLRVFDRPLPVATFEAAIRGG